MWMIDPRVLCQKHLCGEHVETHMFLGHMKLGKKVDGYIKNNCLQMKDVLSRHDELSHEMLSRGYQHNSPISNKEFTEAAKNYSADLDCSVDGHAALVDLLDRCIVCRKNFISLGVRNDQVLKED